MLNNSTNRKKLKTMKSEMNHSNKQGVYGKNVRNAIHYTQCKYLYFTLFLCQSVWNYFY